MNLYWLYNIPNWLFAVITIATFASFGISGLFLTRRLVKRLHQGDKSHNDIIGFYLGAVMVLYGITLGLVAAGTWTTFTSIQDKVSSEAQVIASIYRDVDTYKQPVKNELRADLEDYVHQVITISWPQQQKGIVPSGSGIYLDKFQKHLMSAQPQTLGEQVAQAEVFKQFNVLVEYRRARLNNVTTGLPSAIWCLVIFGGIICIIVTLFFDTRSFLVHFWMTTLLSVLIGLMVFLVGTLDCPFRGTVSVTPAPLQLVYDQLLKSDKSTSVSDTTQPKDKL